MSSIGSRNTSSTEAYSKVSNPQILQVQGVSAVLNPKILRVWAVFAVQRPKYYRALAVLAERIPETLSVHCQYSKYLQYFSTEILSLTPV